MWFPFGEFSSSCCISSNLAKTDNTGIFIRNLFHIHPGSATNFVLDDFGLLQLVAR